MWQLLMEILILLTAAFLFGAIAQKLKQSVIIGYLIAGAVIGPFLFNAEAVGQVAELSVALLLFSIGLEFSVPKTRATLPECHASIDIWIKATGFAKETDELRERCGRLTADVAIHAANIWNAHLAGRSFAETPMSEKQMYCGKCHIKGIAPTKGASDYQEGKYIREVSTNMSCPSCHPGRKSQHPKSKFKQGKKKT